MAEKILVVDDEEIIRESVSFILSKEGYEVTEAENGRVAHEKLLDGYYDLVITDLEMAQMNGLQLMEVISRFTVAIPVIVVTAYGSLDTAIKALRYGAYDYILKPVEFEELIIKIKRLFETRTLMKEVELLRREIQRQYDFSSIIGQSPAMQKTFEIIKTVAGTDSTVLITGNSGTGKELAARAIHYNSKRKNKPFIAVNCGAISENLIESELFGHKKGAFTGAISDKEGFFKAADGGTLFLDEISEMPPQLQVKLLRVLQEREFTPVGTTHAIPINIRFLASTNRNLKEEIQQNRFREDLYYRLNVVEITMPSLKNRKEDIPMLANHFLNKYRHQMGKNISGIDQSAYRALMNYDWKGEVRELENVMERAVIFCQNDVMTLENLPESLRASKDIVVPDQTGSLDEFMNKVEREYIIKTLENCDQDKEKAAKVLNLGLSTLYRKIKELNIQL